MKIFGILNITHNSFSDGSEYLNLDNALLQYAQLIQDGAYMVDIGAISTSYGANLLTSEIERSRLEPVLIEIAKQFGNLERVSIDTFRPDIAEFCIEHGVTMINDVSGGHDVNMLSVLAKNKEVKYVCVCSLQVPANRENRIESIDKLYDHAKFTIDRALDNGILEEQIILDPGIGFTTGPDLSVEVIKNIDKFKKLGFPLYIGHSRKSFMSTGLPAKDSYMKRDPETLAASLYMFLKQIDYIRVHNVALHINALKLFSRLVNYGYINTIVI
ncbi:Dihydropteroate synthase [Candidatus Cyrtobacter comes]|uniref:Dihydropteroate synthase n=1 Tax=Candidatus Cyrtobacter comes TaxID=675776 RepID=A0ABU5L785_9RICK|nr:dihydropteroate synthase [Candidatus Cyrtobacter comes]MDZ5761983.1 Dihydropteroate synthase [Candidatus Cyrtobacter comes]